MTTSSELTGGAGFTFEDRIAAQYLTALLCEVGAAGVSNRIVTRVATQQEAFGEPLDDLVIDFRGADDIEARLSLQVKRSLVVSAAPTNADFRSIIYQAWATVNKPNFRDEIDRCGGATDFVAVGKYRALIDLGEAARASETLAHFDRRFAKGGNASAAVKTVKKDIEALLGEGAGRKVTSAELHRFLRHFVLIEFDYLHESATDPSVAISALASVIHPAQAELAPLVWDRLCALAREGAGRSAEFFRTTLVRLLSPVVTLRGSRLLRADIDRLTIAARAWSRDIVEDVGQTHLDRPQLREDLATKLAMRRFVQIRGLPGTGKSVLLRQCVDEALAKGPTLFLKSDRLEGNGWGSFATGLGVVSSDLEKLLVEFAAIGTPILFVDGIDRLERRHRTIVSDVIQTILSSDLLDQWRIVATLRDSGVEPLRTWLPDLFDGAGVGVVEVKSLSDAEAETLAAGEPALKPLLFGAEAVREIVRRPFFARILSQNFSLDQGSASFAPQSEIDLIENWWRRGGYDAEGAVATRRQRALLALGAHRARHLNAAISLTDLDASVIDVLEDLKADGIIQDVRAGHSVAFSHDIFFEWSFFHRLISLNGGWPAELRAAGEPPMLGRIVDLLSQAEFTDADAWSAQLDALEASDLRSQWTRAWLLGPLSLANFADVSSVLKSVFTVDGFRRLRQAMVWFQAERTIPNAAVLEGLIGNDTMSREDRVQAADLLGHPSDILIWGRFIEFLISDDLEVPVALYPDMLAIFEVWQNVFADFRHPISQAILMRVERWLSSIDHWQDPDLRPTSGERSPWTALSTDFQSFAVGLRRVLLRAARAEPNFVNAYLVSLLPKKRLLDAAFKDILGFSVVLADALPTTLVDLTLAHLRGELPEEERTRHAEEARVLNERRAEIRAKPEAERTRNETLMLTNVFSRMGYSGFSSTEWEGLAIDQDRISYFPASPSKEPFHALFERAPEEALRLVRELSNHAVMAWQQLSRLDHERRSTPIPLNLTFPWGDQQFWGGGREYLWSRGLWAPKPLACAYQALAEWAFEQLEKGEGADELIRRIVTGNTCIAVLGMAVAVAMQSKTPSDSTEPLVIAPRLWRADALRWRQEFSWTTSSLIGFKAMDRSHIEAVQRLNAQPAYRHELRDYSILFTLGPDRVRAERVRKSILAFTPDALFEKEEQRDNAETIAAMTSYCRECASWAEPANFYTQPVPEAPGSSYIIHIDPERDSPAEQEKVDSAQALLLDHRLFRWAESSLEKKIVSDDMSVPEAILAARQIDTVDPLIGEHGHDVRAGAVVGAASVALVFPNLATGDDLDWARATVLRAAAMPEHKDIHWSSVSIISWHPSLMASYGLAGLIEKNASDQDAAARLLDLVGHPLEVVALTAIKVLCSLWDVDPKLSWSGIRLALTLCDVRQLDPEGSATFDPAIGAGRRRAAVADAWKRFQNESEPWPSLPVMPSAWVKRSSDIQSSGYESDVYEDDYPTAAEWRQPEGYWNSQAAAKIVPLLPVAKIVSSEAKRAFLDHCESLVTWTRDRIAPPWDIKGEGSDRRNSDLLEWQSAMGSLFGLLAGYIPAEETAHLFLDPITSLHDEACFPLIHPFADAFICAHVYDAPLLAEQVCPVLDRILDRVIAAHTFERSGYRAGSLDGWHLTPLLESLMLVSVSDAGGAARFANGIWTGLEPFLILIDRTVRTLGWSTGVFSIYLKLVARSRAQFPSGAFADHILHLLNPEFAVASRWHGTMIPARIAGLVQSFADRDSPLPNALAQKLLRILDALVDQGDRRSAALQLSDAFRDVRLLATAT